MEMSNLWSSRRNFFKGSGIAIAMAAGLPLLETIAHGMKKTEKLYQEISPVEDLMREHGVLSRALLIYDEISLRIESGKEFPFEALGATARLIQRFVENYHEKLEENYLFPRFERAGKLVDLVKVLLAQHQAGHRLTTQILALSSKAPNLEEKRRILFCLRSFCRMYRPHKAREDTVLFPSFHAIVSTKEFDSLGEGFEEEEEELFGEGGFDKIVYEVTGIEKRLGVFALSQFTPIE
jgi:hemerythrin-like domain-containing protein